MYRLGEAEWTMCVHKGEELQHDPVTRCGAAGTEKNYFGSRTLPSSDAMKPSTPREGSYASVLRPRDLLGANVQM